MRSKFKSSVLSLSLLFIILYLSACATENVSLSKDINIASIELGDRIPLKAGLYFSQMFRNAKYEIQAEQRFGEVVSVGDALQDGSEKIIRNIFQEMLILEPLDSTFSEPAKKYDVIVAPEVIKMDYEIATKPFKTWFIVHTVIKWNIASPEGKEIYVSTIKSDEVETDKPKHLEVCIKESLENNFQKAQEDIYKSNWWKNQWWKDIK
jgi:hypothetical protein